MIQNNVHKEKDSIELNSKTTTIINNPRISNVPATSLIIMKKQMQQHLIRRIIRKMILLLSIK
ncbi:MAG: hypothetical protein ACRD6U_05235 [Nitrososphaeraceae archaeon]